MMAKKSKKTVEPTKEEVNIPQTVECPQHPDNFLVVQIEGTRLFAKCNCTGIRNNMWKGKVVWEKEIPSDMQAAIPYEDISAEETYYEGDVDNG